MKKTKSIICRITAMMLLLAFAVGSFCSCGKQLSQIDAVKSKNFTVSAGMVSYSLYDTSYYYVNFYGESNLIYYLGIDSTKPLSEQYYDSEKGITWFDVFLDDALNNGFVNALPLCEAALADGIVLTELDKKFIDAEIEEVASMAAEDGLTFEAYVEKIYGKGVTEEDVRTSLEVYRLANKKLYKDYEMAVASSDEIDAYAAQDPDYYLCRDVEYFTLTYSNDSAKNPLIKEYAEKLKAATSEEEFKALVADYKNKDFCVNTYAEGEIPETKAAFYQNTTEEESKTDLEKWIFAKDTVKGSTYLEDSSASCTVYIAVSDTHKNEAETRNMYHVLLSPDIYDSLDNAKLLANNLYTSWVEDGSSLESFKELANKYTTDYATSYTGGYYANVASGDLVSALNNWLFASERKEGDSAVIETEYGVHLIYYSGKGEPYWKVSAIQAIKDEKTADLMESYAELYEVKVIEENLKYIK